MHYALSDIHGCSVAFDMILDMFDAMRHMDDDLALM